MSESITHQKTNPLKTASHHFSRDSKCLRTLEGECFFMNSVCSVYLNYDKKNKTKKTPSGIVARCTDPSSLFLLKGQSTSLNESRWKKPWGSALYCAHLHQKKTPKAVLWHGAPNKSKHLMSYKNIYFFIMADKNRNVPQNAVVPKEYSAILHFCFAPKQMSSLIT